MIKGSGAVPLTNGSGSRKPKNIGTDPRIRIRNTVFKRMDRATVVTKNTSVGPHKNSKTSLENLPNNETKSSPGSIVFRMYFLKICITWVVG
jgi:hypothetical protein